MSRRRGLVVERSGDRVTALTKDGEFVTWRDRRDLMPGEQVLVPSPWFQGFLWRRMIPATVLATVLIVTSLFGYRHYLYARPVLAYVTYDSSGEVPVSIELEVNDRGLVRRAVPLDEAGAAALAGMAVEMQPVQTVLSKLRQAMPDSKQVIIAFIPVTEAKDPESSDAPKSGRENRFSSLVMGLAQQVFDSVQEATAVMLDMETRAVAQELGISAGRAASWALWNIELDTLPEEPGSTGIETMPDPGQAEPGSQEPGEPVLTVEPFSTQIQSSSPASEGNDEPVSSQPVEGVAGGSTGSGAAVQSGTPSQPGHPGAGAKPSHGTAGTESAKPGPSKTPDVFEEPWLNLPPGQQKKVDPEALLEMIKGGLPDLRWKDDDKPLSKKSAKELEKLTKDWLNSLLEASKKASHKDNDRGEDEDDHKKPGAPDSKPGASKEGPGGNKGNSQEPGKGQEKPGKSGKEEKQEKPGGSDSKGKDEKHEDGKGKGGKSGAGPVDGKGSGQAGDEKQVSRSSAGSKTGQKQSLYESDDSPSFYSKYSDADKDEKQGGFTLRDRFRWTSEFLRRLWK